MFAGVSHFAVQAAFERPTAMPAEMNNEGLAIAPESACVEGQSQIFWSDDGDTGSHALRTGTLACGPVFWARPTAKAL